MKKRTKVLFICGSLFVCTYLILMDKDELNGGQRPSLESTKNTLVLSKSTKNKYTKTDIFASPFALDDRSLESSPSTNSNDKLEEVELAKRDLRENMRLASESASREKKMTTLGYQASLQMQDKTKEELFSLAASGNADAMTSLAARNLVELNRMPDKYDEINKNKKIDEIGVILNSALSNGNIFAASILSTLAKQKNNTLDQLAWQMLAEQLGDNFAADTYRNSEAFLNASERFRQDAYSRASQLRQTLKPLTKNQ